MKTLTILGALALLILLIGGRFSITSHSNGTLWLVNRFTADVYFCDAKTCRLVGRQ
jgi:hypothetical protein